ncbi:hypothetical protein [Angustibacter luteus]|uniref:Uncharacterized protein n=1 Tax=Angustibacter luteus TaxID=658456 RepID=A0ABW1JJ12_9ACTN
MSVDLTGTRGCSGCDRPAVKTRRLAGMLLPWCGFCDSDCPVRSPGGGLQCRRPPHTDGGHVFEAAQAPDGRHDDAAVDW